MGGLLGIIRIRTRRGIIHCATEHRISSVLESAGCNSKLTCDGEPARPSILQLGEHPNGSGGARCTDPAKCGTVHTYTQPTEIHGNKLGIIRISHMQEAVVLDMPTDLRPTNAPVSPFELEEDIRNKKNSLGFTALTVDIPEASKVRLGNIPRPLPLWKTPEFFFYYLVAAAVIPYMVWVPINLSSRASQAYYHAMFILIYKLLVAVHANYAFFHYKLSPGWLFGRQVVSTFNQ